MRRIFPFHKEQWKSYEVRIQCSHVANPYATKLGVYKLVLIHVQANPPAMIVYFHLVLWAASFLRLFFGENEIRSWTMLARLVSISSPNRPLNQKQWTPSDFSIPADFASLTLKRAPWKPKKKSRKLIIRKHYKDEVTYCLSEHLKIVPHPCHR